MTVKKLIEKVSSRFKLALVFILSSQNDFSEKKTIYIYTDVLWSNQGLLGL